MRARWIVIIFGALLLALTACTSVSGSSGTSGSMPPASVLVKRQHPHTSYQQHTCTTVSRLCIAIHSGPSETRT